MRLAKSAASELKASFVEGTLLADERRRALLQPRGLPPPTPARGEGEEAAGRREDGPEGTNTGVGAGTTGNGVSGAELSRAEQVGSHRFGKDRRLGRDGGDPFA